MKIHLLGVGCAGLAQTKILRIPLKTLFALEPSARKYQYYPSIPWQSTIAYRNSMISNSV